MKTLPTLKEFEALKARVEGLESELAETKLANEALTEQVRLLEAILYAKRSEKKAKPNKNELQYSLFDELEFVAQQESEGVAEAVIEQSEVVEIPAHTRTKKGRKPISDDLPRVDILHDIADDEKVCACGCALKQIGEVVSEKLHVVPQKIEVERHIRPKYACPHCEGTAEEEKSTVKIAPMPKQFIKHGIVTPSLIAYIVVNKFCDALPFYRQNRMFHRFGVEISRSTMSSWANQAATKCKPLWQLYLSKLRAGNIINMDETTVQVLGEEGRENSNKSYMWLGRGGQPEQKVVLFHYAPSRAGKVARELVGDFRGYLQTDGYAGYTALGRAEGITHVGCLAHVRRKFVDVTKASKNKSKSGVASKAINLIGNIYHLENMMKKANLSDEDIMKVRQEKVMPTFENLKKLLDETLAPPSLALGKAVTYALGQWPYVVAYMEHPRLTPDNNAAENAIRPFTVGRKNWLFSGSPRGARSSAILYSMVETAKANGVEPLEYLFYVFENVAFAESDADWEKLLPWNMPKK